MLSHPAGSFVHFEDHQRLLLAAEGERDRLNKQAAELADDAFVAEARAETAKKHLVEVSELFHNQVAALFAATPSKDEDRASTRGGDALAHEAHPADDGTHVAAGGLDPDGGSAPKASQGHPTLAMMRAGHRVRGGLPNWLKGAPSHVLAELLSELAEDGWELIRNQPEGSGDEDCERPQQRGCGGLGYWDGTDKGLDACGCPDCTTKKQPAPSGEWPEVVLFRWRPENRLQVPGSESPEELRAVGCETRRYVPAEPEGER